MLITVIRVSVEQKIFNPDAVDAQIYCINTSDTVLSIATTGESFITIDEETGDTANQSGTNEFVLAIGEVRLIAEVKGWEWDGHVGVEISVHSEGKPVQVNSYDFKTGSGDYFIDELKLHGRIIPVQFSPQRR